jgi:fructose-1,6-bisphosphatase/inositol monophosphatase family enzyme
MHPLSSQVEELMRNTAVATILPYYQKLAAHQIEEKAPTPSGLTDLVTIADHEAEAMLSDGLAKLLPSAAIVGEEACAADPTLLGLLGDAQCWIIDPVDGTNNFGAGHPPFGIIIALAEAGQTVAGWLYDPLTGRMCHAHKGRGAWIDGQSVKARESGQPLPVAAISLIYMDAEKREDTRARLEGRFTTVDIPRCAAEQYPRLVLGQNDVSLFERVLPWDHAAGVLFTNEAGGKVARLDGSAYSPAHQQKGLIGASSPRYWDIAAASLFG